MSAFGIRSVAAWQRVGIHPKRGELTIERIAELVAEHDENHLNQIERLPK